MEHSTTMWTIVNIHIPATSGTFLLLAVRVMLSPRRHIAIGTAEPRRKMCVFGIIGYWLKDFPVRIFNRGISRACRDACVRHFLLTAVAKFHRHPAAPNIDLDTHDFAANKMSVHDFQSITRFWTPTISPPWFRQMKWVSMIFIFKKANGCP